LRHLIRIFPFIELPDTHPIPDAITRYEIEQQTGGIALFHELLLELLRLLRQAKTPDLNAIVPRRRV
jgi:hypothetical protein